MEAVFLKLLNMSITASYLVIAVVLLRLVLKRAPKVISLILWALVGVRLILPISLESSFSLVPSAQVIPPSITSSQSQSIVENLPNVDNPSAEKPSVDNPSTNNPSVDNPSVDNPSVDSPSSNNTPPQQNVPSISNPSDSQSAVPGVTKDRNLSEIITSVASIVWISGMGVMLTYALISYIRVRRRVREAVKSEGNIMVCDHIASPFILGIIKPKIYIPSSTDLRDVYYVLAHENAHLKRRDHFWKPLGFFLLSIYWFNPVLWVAYILLCRDIELACDEKVIKSLGIESKKPYSTALVNCSVTRKAITVCPLAFGEVGVKRRVKNVLNYKKPTFWIIIVALLICIVVAVCFLTIRPSDNNDDTSTTTNSDTTTTTSPNENPTTNPDTQTPSKLHYQKVYRTQNHNGGSTSDTAHVYAYNDKNLVVKHFVLDDSGRITERYEYEYDENGVLIYDVSYLNGAKFHEYRYDSHGNVINEIIFDRDGSIFNKNTYTRNYDSEYDKDGNLVAEICYGKSPDNLYYRYEYNKDGKKTLERVYGDGVHITEYEYDENGILTSSHYEYYNVDGGTLFSTRETEYDKNSNVVLELLYGEDGNLEFKDVYEYDEYGNRTLEARYDGDGNEVDILEAEYTYDESGNIKAKSGYENGYALYHLTYSDLYYYNFGEKDSVSADLDYDGEDETVILCYAQELPLTTNTVNNSYMLVCVIDSNNPELTMCGYLNISKDSFLEKDGEDGAVFIRFPETPNFSYQVLYIEDGYGIAQAVK